MKKMLIILAFLSIVIFSAETYGIDESRKATSGEKKTVIEKLSKKDKLKIIYINGGVILLASCIVLYPIIKEKRK